MDLNFSPTLKVPRSAATRKLAFIGTSGGGKTNGAFVLVEELLEASTQVVVIDPAGVYYGLRSSKDGKKRGYDIPIFGGLHGDIPLTAASGAAIGKLLASERISAVVDVSQFEDKRDQNRFMADFVAAFFFAKKNQKSPVMLVFEEAQEFIPEAAEKERDDTRMVAAMKRLARIGRNFGIGYALVSQTPQAISKRALNLCDLVFMFRTLGAQEIDSPSVKKWMRQWAKDRADVVGELESLETGKALVWSPEFLKRNDVVKFRHQRSYDTHATPDYDENAPAIQLADIDLEAIKASLGEVIEQAEATDPQRLAAQLRAAQEEIRRLKQASTAYKVTPIIERPVLDAKSLASMNEAINNLSKPEIVAEFAAVIEKQWREGLAAMKAIVQSLAEAFPPDRPLPSTQWTQLRVGVPVPEAFLPAPAAPVSKPVRISDDVSGPERAILGALKRWRRLNASNLALLSGYRPGTGHFNNVLGGLERKGWIMRDGGSVLITQEPNDIQPIANTRRELFDYWRGKIKSKGARAIMDVLWSWHANTKERNMSVEAVAIATKYKDGTGHFNNLLGELRGAGIIEGRGYIALNPIFVEDGYFVS